MKKTIFACLALAYAGLAFSEPAILTEAKNYKLSNGQTMEQALANYSHCDQKEWGVVDNRAIFVCRDKLYKETLDAAYKTVLDRGWAIDDATLEKASKTLGLSKELVYESIKEQRKNARSALITNIENMERQRDSHVVNSATQSVVGKRKFPLAG